MTLRLVTLAALLGRVSPITCKALDRVHALEDEAAGANIGDAVSRGAPEDIIAGAEAYWHQHTVADIFAPVPRSPVAFAYWRRIAM